jgi:hypothetical protein
MRIPVIMLTQRPVWLSRFVFSESSFFQFFPLTDERDEDTCIRLSRAAMDFTSLPEYCSYYYDVGRRRLNLFRPVPPEEEILAAINEKLSPRRRII